MTPAFEFLVTGMTAVGVCYLPLVAFWFFPRYRETARALSLIPLLLFSLTLMGFLIRLMGERFNAYAVERGFEPVTDWVDFFFFFFRHYLGSGA